jgi:magnesium-protoporphyrin O-methyltransferase
MAGCCDPGDYADVFTTASARRSAARYRKRGLDRTATRIVDWLAEQGIEGATVLELGGGVGGIQIDLLRRGAARATNLELVDSYDNEAVVLAAEAGLSGRISRRRLDLATEPEAVPQHDVVVLHRVVCCYPDYERLLAAAAARATRLLVFSHPPRSWMMRAAFWSENAVRRLGGTTFRVYVHPPTQMLAVVQSSGFRLAHRHHGLAWDVTALVR